MEVFEDDECWVCDRCGEMNWGDENLRLAIEGGEGPPVYFCKCMTLKEAHDLFFFEAAAGEWDAAPS